MSFLTINGHAVRVELGQSRRTLRRKGNKTRSLRGQLRKSSFGNRLELPLRACFSDFGASETLVNVVLGTGHLFRFASGIAADTGLQLLPVSLGSARFDRAQSPFPAFPNPSSLYLEASARTRFVVDAQLFGEWTLHFWVRTVADGWRPVTKRSDGAQWVDGVRDDSAWPDAVGQLLLSVSLGRVWATTDGTVETWLSELAVLPFLAAESFVVSWHGATAPWGPLPAVRVRGDLIVPDFAFAYGRDVKTRFVGKKHEDPFFGWVSNARFVEFALVEVADLFERDTTFSPGQGAVL